MSDFGVQAMKIHNTLSYAIKFIERLPSDCMGNEPELGYPFRDEWLEWAREALEQLAEQAQ